MQGGVYKDQLTWLLVFHVWWSIVWRWVLLLLGINLIIVTFARIASISLISPLIDIFASAIGMLSAMWALREALQANRRPLLVALAASGDLGMID